MSDPRYALGVSEAEIQRLRRQNEAVGVHAEWLLDQIDVRPGWRTVDVGCGPLGLLEMLSDRVGPSGAVLGVDVNDAMVAAAKALVAAGGRGNVEVLRADAGATQLPRRSFDLVHERLVLVNVPAETRTAIVKEMVALARPGGWVAAQEIDAISWVCEPMIPAWERLCRAFLQVFQLRGADGYVGRRLPRMLREAGLVDVRCRAHGDFWDVDHPWRHLLLQFTDIARDRAVAAGLLAAEEIDELEAELREHLADPETTVVAPVFAQAWGRVPS